MISFYDDPEVVPEYIDLSVDMMTCDVSIVCDRTRPAVIGLHLAGDADERVEFTAFAALKLEGEERSVFACEDCLGWLEDVFSPDK
jgi:hypothetical protein